MSQHNEETKTPQARLLSLRHAVVTAIRSGVFAPICSHEGCPRIASMGVHEEGAITSASGYSGIFHFCGVHAPAKKWRPLGPVSEDQFSVIMRLFAPGAVTAMEKSSNAEAEAKIAEISSIMRILLKSSFVKAWCWEPGCKTPATHSRRKRPNHTLCDAHGAWEPELTSAPALRALLACLSEGATP